MVGYAGSPIYTAYVDMTLTRSKVKVKVTGLLNFRRLAKPCMLAAMTTAPLRGFLVCHRLDALSDAQLQCQSVSVKELKAVAGANKPKDDTNWKFSLL